MIRPATPADAPRLAQIYNHYIEHTIISFERDLVSDIEMAQRLESVTATHPWLVKLAGDTIVGYAYASQWQERWGYRYSAQSAIYIASEHTGAGHGRSLYADLFARLGELDVHTVIAGISLPNPASIAIHESFGFIKAAHFSRVGRKFD
ncbi:MAG: N-acetyltransferase family protein, partial [Planctomycetota bacterium]